MNRKLAITAAVIATFAIIGACGLFAYIHSQADPAPLPTSLDVQGTDLTTLGPIQPAGATFTVTFDYTPLNHNGSVVVLSNDKQMIDYKNDPSGNAGEIVLHETSYSPIYIQTYGATWHLTAQ